MITRQTEKRYYQVFHKVMGRCEDNELLVILLDDKRNEHYIFDPDDSEINHLIDESIKSGRNLILEKYK